jgi:hypothetical protein
MIGRPPLGARAPLAGATGSGCQVTVGFFTHRPCGQPGAGACGVCRRFTCQDHLRREDGANPTCVECAARQQEGGVLDDLADDMSFYLYRQGYYRRVYGTSYTGPQFFDEVSDRSALDATNLAHGEAVDADADTDQASALDS